MLTILVISVVGLPQALATDALEAICRHHDM
jgi:hypothetical protein